MLAPAPAPAPSAARSAARAASTAGAGAAANAVTPPAERRCPYCCADAPQEAKKCRACGEWLVRTSAGAAPAALRLLGWLWVGLTLLAAGGLWAAGRAARFWILLRATDPAISPLALDVALYGLLALVLLQGLTVGVALSVLSRLAPRRPRWWT